MTQKTMEEIQEILRVGLQPAAEKISNLIGHVVTLEPQHIVSSNRSTLERYSNSHVVVESELDAGNQPLLLWMFQPEDVTALLGNLLGEQEALDDFSLSAFQEIISPTLASFHQAIGSFTGKELTCKESQTKLFQVPDYYDAYLSEKIIVATITLTLAERTTQVDIIFDSSWEKALEKQETALPVVESTQADEVGVKEIAVPTFNIKQQPLHTADKKQNLDLIMNVPLHVSIELGKTKRKIKDIMNFSQGYVLELEKQTGAPVDIVVNGQLIARGDVVVIDENFAVRVTEIINVSGLVSNEN
ncbi:MAG: flagellar motor switch protein FliN [Erysipelotrichaceae bacterium]